MTPQTGQVEDEALLADHKQPSATFTEFYRRNVELVLRFCARRGVNAHDAADLTAEVFAAALLARYRFDPGRSAAKSWLLGIADHKLADRGRRLARDDRARRALAVSRITLTERDVADYAALCDEVGSVAAELAKLPPDQRDAVTARVLGDESYPEISKRLGISEAAVRQRVSRGLARVRNRIKEGA